MFDFYYPEYVVNESSGWLSLLFTLIGTFLGFLSAFCIARWSERKQKKNDLTKQNDIYKKRLLHFTNLISHSLDVVNNQLTYYEELAEKINKEPAEIHKPQLAASEDLYRIQRMDTEGIFLAYNEIIKENEDKFKDYKNIYNIIDYIYLRLKQAIDSNEKHVNFIHQDQMYIKKHVEGLSIELIKTIRYIEAHTENFKDISEYKIITVWSTRYRDLVQNTSSLKKIKDDFIIPFYKQLDKELTTTPYYSVLFTLATKVINRYSHLEFNAKSFASEVKNIKVEMQEPIKKLKEINSKIEQSIATYNVSLK